MPVLGLRGRLRRHNDRMTKRRRFWLFALVPAALLLATVVALRVWVGSADLRERVAREASAALGVPVQVEALEFAVWPLPALALRGVVVQTRPALSVARIEARPAWGALLAGRVQLATLVVRDAQLPQAGIDSLLAALSKKKQGNESPRGLQPESAENSPPLPQRIVARGLTWTDARGRSLTLDADARLGADALPDSVSARIVAGRLEGTRVNLDRESPERWQLKAGIGGGTVSGPLTLKGQGALRGPWKLAGQLQTTGVEVAALTAPARSLSGRLEAQTTLSGGAPTLGALADALQTQTKFTVRQAVLHGVDLAKAVRSVGLSRGGETRLDTLAGQVQTQGRAARLDNLVASSGVLAATGHVAVAANKALSGRVSVDLAGGVVGVPLMVGGTVDAPEVTLTRGAMLGAAIGTALLPGVGTGAGAKLGDKAGSGLGSLFGR